MIEYKALEQSSLTTLGIQSVSFNSGNTSFFSVISFLMMLSFIAVVGVASIMIVKGGMLRMKASEESIRSSNEVFRRVVFGVLGVFSLFIIITTINSGLITGDIDLGKLRVGSGDAITTNNLTTKEVTTSSKSTSGAVNAGCQSKEIVIQNIQNNDACKGVSCSALFGCNYSSYLATIEKYTSGDQELRKMAIVTLCKESKGVLTANNKNPDGTYDCGVMQINQKDPCPASYDVDANIQQGINKLRSLKNNTNQTYPGFPRWGGVFASYNCCSNGTAPNSASNDCNTSSGFPGSVPKWGCPINPGDGQFNMCTVKNYTCDLVKCMEQL